MDANEKALIIFVKNPIAGRVKTRLAIDIGDEAALQTYLFLLNKTADAVAASSAKVYVYYSDEIISNDAIWKDIPHASRRQLQADLGARIAAAFEEVTKAHSKTIIIGSDCPQLTSEHIEEAFEALTTVESVIGPAEDGGYYLLGLRNHMPELFADVPWSSNKVLATTIQRLVHSHKSICLLDELFDVDSLAEWQRFQNITENNTD